MTRESQNSFTHHMDAEPELPDNAVRYSLTFRRVHWTNLNSTYMVGDSNFGRIKFGEGRSHVGKSTPGCVGWAPHVDDIDPLKCASFQNIMVMCGTNDLKGDTIANNAIKQIYKRYKYKFEQIRLLNPQCNIFVCPVLPTRSHKINGKIDIFNQFIYTDLIQSNIGVRLVAGFAGFVEYSGLLKANLHDPRAPGDALHINDDGYRILVRLLKREIFASKKGGHSRVGGKTFANATRGGPVRPV